MAYLAASFAGFSALVGHMFPVWLKFKGGKGVATGMGAFLAISPAAVMVSLVFFIATVAISRYVSLGSMLGALVFPAAAWWINPLTRSAGTMTFVSLSALFIIVRHRSNIQRLLAGNENRLW